jgi:hypothetical protein
MQTEVGRVVPYGRVCVGGCREQASPPGAAFPPPVPLVGRGRGGGRGRGRGRGRTRGRGRWGARAREGMTIGVSLEDMTEEQRTAYEAAVAASGKNWLGAKNSVRSFCVLLSLLFAWSSGHLCPSALHTFLTPRTLLARAKTQVACT